VDLQSTKRKAEKLRFEYSWVHSRQKMEYRITLKNQIKALNALIFGTILFCAAIYILYKEADYDVNSLIIGSLCFLVLLMPAFFLHIEYFLINKTDIVDVNASLRTVSFNDKTPVPFINIEKIILVMSPVLYRNGNINITPFDNYHYAVISMKGGEQFIFTSLMAFRVEEAMKHISGVTIEKKRRLVASPLLLRYWLAFWS
jgi:hypothetical protein